MKSERNKTIDFDLSEGEKYLKKATPESLYDGGLNQVVCGDFFEAIKKVQDESVDLLIVDPPYDLNKNFHGEVFKRLGDEAYAEYTEKWIRAVKPKLKSTASVYVCSDWRSSVSLGTVIENNFILRNRITWAREKGRGARANGKNSMEDVFFATVGNDYTFNLKDVMVRKKVVAPYRENGKPKDWEETEQGNFRNTCPSNFWDDIPVPYWSMAENTAHPTQKPEKLIAKLILASSDKGDVVLDPFAGSGTTAVVAKKLGRNYIAFEQNPRYCAWAEYRLELAEENCGIQGYKNGVFWARGCEPKGK